jgi:site-specific DNA-methyltransferase (adenine-specific)
VDGVLYFQDDDTGPKKAVVSVQGGSSVHPAMVRELAAVMAREEATMGFFVTLTEPTPGMRREAQALGLYRPSPAARAVPRVQLLTVAGLLAGRERPLLPGLPPGEEDAPPPPAAGNGRSSRGKAGAGAGRGGAGAGLAGG